MAFEGPIAAGKTTLAELLANYLNATAILEAFANNEFLADFYGNRDRWALPMQLEFLMSRHRQLSEISPSATVVADHTYAKDRVFASLLLRGREMRLYDRVHERVGGHVATPDLIVYVDAPDDILLDRIRKRGRDYEQSITPEYLGELRQAYERDLLRTTGTPVIHEPTGDLNLTSTGMMDALFARVVSSLSNGAA